MLWANTWVFGLLGLHIIFLIIDQPFQVMRPMTYFLLESMQFGLAGKAADI